MVNTYPCVFAKSLSAKDPLGYVTNDGSNVGDTVFAIPYGKQFIIIHTMKCKVQL